MRIEAFIQARMGSSRLPGKVMKEVLDRPLLDFLLERLSFCRQIDQLRVLTSLHIQDDLIADFCHHKGVPCFRGAELNVLERFYEAALVSAPDAIVRITADCPLIDPTIVDAVIKAFRDQNACFDYVSNTLKRTFPRGMDVEVFSFEALKSAFLAAKRADEQEHVTLHLYQHPEKFRLHNIAAAPDWSRYRLTVDRKEDLALVSFILNHLAPSNPRFSLADIIALLEAHPELILLDT